MLINLILLGFGFGLLYYGAQWLVKGAVNLARSLGVSPMVIGLTVASLLPSRLRGIMKYLPEV